MKLVFLYGPPASGKLTIGEELAALTGYKLFHNHLVVDTLLAVFDFGSGPFVELREQIWLDVFSQACKAGLAGLIFTFAPEPTVRSTFVPNIIAVVEALGGEVLFVEIACPVAEIRARLSAESRHQHKKLTSLSLFEELNAQGAFSASHMPTPLLTIDSSVLTPAQAAGVIAEELDLR